MIIHVEITQRKGEDSERDGVRDGEEWIGKEDGEGAMKRNRTEWGVTG